MRTKIEWQARVNGLEKVDDLGEFALDVKRGLEASELVPDTAWIEDVHFDFNRRPVATVRWDTDNEMELTPNYVPAGSDGPKLAR